jgi:hypothetical protein
MVLCGIPARGPQDTEMFNGKDLSGWEGNTEVWKVEGGEIVGKGALKTNEFLWCRIPVSDFRLVVEVKLVEDKRNSGIQFRSRREKDGHAKGYQADVGAGWWGKLYHENGRGLLWNKPGDPHVKKGDWNVYEIVAVGNRILTALNGSRCVDLEDPKADPELDFKGQIALQVHSGEMTEVRFRNFKLEHNPKPGLSTEKK